MTERYQALWAQQYVEGDLSSRGHIFVAAATVIALFFVLRLVRRRQLSGKYALLWTAVAGLLAVLAIWPGLLTRLAEFAGVFYPPTLFLLVTTGFLFIVVVHFSYELSKLEERSRTLAEEIALLRAQSWAHDQWQVADESAAAATDDG